MNNKLTGNINFQNLSDDVINYAHNYENNQLKF